MNFVSVSILLPHRSASKVYDSSNPPVSDAKLVVQFVRGFSAGLCGNDRGGNYHSDKRQGNQQVMHSGVSWCGSAEPVHIRIIGVIGKNLNPTKTVSFSRQVHILWHFGVSALGYQS
jgi:hypothetical protein